MAGSSVTPMKGYRVEGKMGGETSAARRTMLRWEGEGARD